MVTPMKRAVCALIIHRGRILCVTRRSNTAQFGLPGGKVEPRDKNDLDALLRELWEEIGRIVRRDALTPIFTKCDDGEYETTTFLLDAAHTEEIDIMEGPNAEGMLVLWKTPEEVRTAQPFPVYNRELLSLPQVQARLSQ